MNETTTAIPPIAAAEIARAVDFIRQARAALPDQPRVAVTRVEREIEARWPDSAQRRVLWARLIPLLGWLSANAPAEMTQHEATLTLRAAIIAAGQHPLSTSGKFGNGFTRAVESIKKTLIADLN